MKARILYIGLMLVGIMGLATAAQAGSPDFPGSGHRSGLTFGAAIGGGPLACSGDGCGDFDEALSLEAHIGAMATPSLAILFDAWWMFHTDGDLTVSQGIFTAAVQFWPIQHFYLRGGLGVARTDYSYSGRFVDVTAHSELVPAFSVAIGVEPISSPSFGLDILLKYGTGFYADGDTRVQNIALAVGVSFY